MNTRFIVPSGRTCSDGGGSGGGGGGGGEVVGEDKDATSGGAGGDVALVELESVGVVWVTREMQTRRSEAEMVKREGRNWRSVATAQRRRSVVRRSLSSAA